MKRRDLLAGIALAAITKPLRVARSASLQAFGGELVAALLEPAKPQLDRGNPRTFDPFLARTRLEREIARALHLPMAGFLDGIPEGRSWSFSLASGLRFPDGSPVQASDAVASLARVHPGIANVLDIETSEATGPHTFRVTTKRAQPSLPAMLGSFEIPLASAAAGDPLFGPAGIGPFSLTAGGTGRPSADVVLAANPRCPRGRAFLDRLVLTPIPDGPALATALRKGQIHAAAAQTTVAETSGAKLMKAPAAATIVLAINTRLQPALRSRIAGAPDRKILADVFMNDRVAPASTLLPPALLGPLPAGPIPPVVQQKGNKTPLSLFVSNASAAMADVAARLVWDLSAVGVQATIGWRHPADMEVDASSRADLLLFEWVPAASDPAWAITAEPLFKPASSAEARLPDDADARATIARTLDDGMRAANVLVPIAHPIRLLRALPRVEGLALDGMGRVSWADVSFKRGAP